MISKIRQKISKTRQKRPVYKAYGPNRLADNFTNTTLCGRKHAASKRKTDAVGHRSEHPGKADHAGCETTLSAFFGRGGADETRPSAGRTPRREREEIVRAQGRRPRREREEIVRAPRGKLRPEAGDRPAPGREAPAHHPIEGVGAGRNMMRCVLTVVCGAVCRSGRHSERKPARG